MKRLLIFTAFSLLLIPVSQSFAAMSDTDILGTADGATLGFTPSNKVVMFYASDSASNNQTYVAMAKHTGGDRAYATTTRTNLLVTDPHDDCPGTDAIICVGKLPGSVTVLDLANGVDNVEGLTGWTVL